MLTFALNISITLRDLPFLARIDRAAQLGFGAIEFWWPAGEDLRAVAQKLRDSGLTVALCNLDGGNLAAGKRGLLNDPAQSAYIRDHVPAALEFAATIGCPRLNALVGNRLVGVDDAAQLALVREQLAWACELARPAGMTLLVEALNAHETPHYLITNTQAALALIDSVAAPNLQLQYDMYHMQRMEGNIAATIQSQVGRIGHIQVADSPGRHQPGTGELNFHFLFQTIIDSGYSGLIALEYIPLGKIEESLAWLPADRRGPVALSALRL